ncbi:MAG: hypothetical protein RLZZ127_2439, partial [Planctomycetota bacterium]
MRNVRNGERGEPRNGEPKASPGTPKLQIDAEPGAAAGGILGVELAAVALDQDQADRQSEAGAVLAAGGKGLEQARADGGVDPWAVVVDQ